MLAPSIVFSLLMAGPLHDGECNFFAVWTAASWTPRMTRIFGKYLTQFYRISTSALNKLFSWWGLHSPWFFFSLGRRHLNRTSLLVCPVCDGVAWRLAPFPSIVLFATLVTFGITPSCFRIMQCIATTAFFVSIDFAPFLFFTDAFARVPSHHNVSSLPT